MPDRNPTPVNNICKKNLFLFLAKFVKMIRFGTLKFFEKLGDLNILIKRYTVQYIARIRNAELHYVDLETDTEVKIKLI
jgi:hypothetical protein